MHLFAYGTLMAEQVWQRLVVVRYRREEAELVGFRRLAVAGAGYPGLLEAEQHVVRGVVYRDLATEDIARLDRFEGEEYRRIKVTVRLADGSELTCQTYLFRPEYRHRLSDREWSFEDFVSHGLAAFLADYKGW